MAYMLVRSIRAIRDPQRRRYKLIHHVGHDLRILQRLGILRREVRVSFQGATRRGKTRTGAYPTVHPAGGFTTYNTASYPSRGRFCTNKVRICAFAAFSSSFSATNSCSHNKAAIENYSRADVQHTAHDSWPTAQTRTRTRSPGHACARCRLGSRARSCDLSPSLTLAGSQ